LNRPPALRIPAPKPPPVVATGNGAPSYQPVKTPRDPLADLRQAKQFAKHCGGAGKALEILTNMPTIPVDTLKEYLTILGEE
jgi:hypothetical protein